MQSCHQTFPEGLVQHMPVALAQGSLCKLIQLFHFLKAGLLGGAVDVKFGRGHDLARIAASWLHFP